MSLTKHQRKQKQKEQIRRRNIIRVSNIERNIPSERYRLDVEKEGKWIEGVRYWRLMEDVEWYQNKTESLRKDGEEILKGRIFDTVKRVFVSYISASKPKGSAPDKIEDGVKACEIV